MLDIELYTRGMRDHVDRIFDQWATERPELDRSAMGVLARILRASRLTDLQMNRVFSEHGLNRGEFDVLASLRRSGAPFQLNPGELSSALLLSTGTMTSRLDRLEGATLIRRLPDPADRRGVLVELTPRGLKLIERALDEHAANEERILAGLSEQERRSLTGLLRKFLLSLGDRDAALGGEPIEH